MGTEIGSGPDMAEGGPIKMAISKETALRDMVQLSDDLVTALVAFRTEREGATVAELIAYLEQKGIYRTMIKRVQDARAALKA